MNEATLVKRRPWLAALLSILCTGLGHIYCGRIVVGLALFAMTMFFVPFAVYLLVFGYSTVLMFATIFLSLVSFGVSLYAVIASFLLARKIGNQYQLKDYNHPVVYGALLLIVGFCAPTSSAVFLRDNVIEAFYCPAKSMLPNIIEGDRFLADKRVYRDADPDYGDVVVFHNPNNRKINYVKRVIGRPGDRIEIRRGVVLLNGKPLPQKPTNYSVMQTGEMVKGTELFEETNGERRYLILKDKTDPSKHDFQETLIPPGHVFVLGDNRDHSNDSRKFGFVPIGDLKGQAKLLYWPAARWTRIGKIR